MLIQSTRFGQLEIADSELIYFPHAIPGFPEETMFAFLPFQPDSPFAFLQSAKEPDLAFVIVQPFTFFKEYSFTLDDIVVAELGLSDENTPGIFNIVRIPDQTEEMTANLLAPIIINWENGKAMQIVLEKSSYTVRHRLFPQGFPDQSERGGK
ncbi:Flagellar assembly factor FliW [Sporomusa ovata DSM 2662]|uniref:Flagellar assembly factor FliW n=1 Tax=Sporomusa ovata TaxID=2378 RepID=A0A0U1KT74_9FIRM|nr:flagellar assembly protein FliW [Sporomusa ovata]EQB26375.1 flagellar assembly factor FliW [Sporomusa ovata DSM 2662]CQR70455.1 Flagellar assembly factor FliW [Sporomusa ovata]